MSIIIPQNTRNTQTDGHIDNILRALIQDNLPNWALHSCPKQVGRRVASCQWTQDNIFPQHQRKGQENINDQKLRVCDNEKDEIQQRLSCDFVYEILWW